VEINKTQILDGRKNLQKLENYKCCLGPWQLTEIKLNRNKMTTIKIKANSNMNE